jgi:hypothetical protein
MDRSSSKRNIKIFTTICDVACLLEKKSYQDGDDRMRISRVLFLKTKSTLFPPKEFR